MKIGIACITYNRPAHLEWWIKQVKENLPADAAFHIANDNKDRRGVAFRSTECLRELYNSGCEYFFLFNDDCAPIKAGWCELFIEAHKVSGQHHFMYLHETPSVKRTEMRHFEAALRCTTINIYDNALGVMLFMTREAVEKVGAFCPNFGVYGYEHANYSNRVALTGLSPVGRYACPAGAEEYIYSLDIDNSRPEWHKKLKHKSSMSAREALMHAQKNAPVYQRDTQIFYSL